MTPPCTLLPPCHKRLPPSSHPVTLSLNACIYLFAPFCMFLCSKFFFCLFFSCITCRSLLLTMLLSERPSVCFFQHLSYLVFTLINPFRLKSNPYSISAVVVTKVTKDMLFFPDSGTFLPVSASIDLCFLLEPPPRL